MDRKEISEKLSIMISENLKAQGLDLVELICNYQGRDLFLRLLVDKPEGGIIIKECAEVNRRLSAMLNEANILEQSYILEVSSPGLDRPLSSKNDFIRCLNKKVKFFLSEFINGKLEWDGVINKVSEGKVYVSIGEVILEIPLDKINKAKQII